MTLHSTRSDDRRIQRALTDLRAATFSPDEVAARLGRSPAAVHLAVYRGRLPAVRVGRAVLIPRSAVDALHPTEPIAPGPPGTP